MHKTRDNKAMRGVTTVTYLLQNTLVLLAFTQVRVLWEWLFLFRNGQSYPTVITRVLHSRPPMLSGSG